MAVSSVSPAVPSGAAIFTDTDNAGTVITVKASSAVVHIVTIDNSSNGAATYLKIWNSAGAIVIGTTVPDEIIYVAASASITLAYVGGKTFGTGLQIACTTSAALAGTTGPTSDVTVRIVYV